MKKQATKCQRYMMKKKFNWEEHSARLSMVAIGIICVVLSIWYTRSFFILDSGLPPTVATLLSSVIALFNSFALASASFLIHRKKRFMGIVLVCIWIATTAFDIFTVAGSQSHRLRLNDVQSEQIQIKQQQNQTKASLLAHAYQQSQEEVNRLQSSIKELRLLASEKASEQARLQKLRTDNPDNKSYESQFWTARSDANVANKRVDEEQKHLDEALKKQSSLYESYLAELNRQSEETQGQAQEKPKPSFADWLHLIFPFIPKQFLQFFLAIIPAFFIDLISPIAMSFGLTLAQGDLINPEAEETSQTQPTKRKKRKKEVMTPQENQGQDQDGVEEITKTEEAFAPPVEIIEPEKPKVSSAPLKMRATDGIAQWENLIDLKPPAEYVKIPESPKPIKKEQKENIPPVKKEKPDAITKPQAVPEVKPRPQALPHPTTKPNHLNDLDNIPSDLTDADSKPVVFRFGKTTAKTGRMMRRLIQEIYSIVEATGEFDIQQLKDSTALTERAFFILWNKLNEITISGQQLFTAKRGEQNVYKANFTQQIVLDFVLEEVQGS